MVALVAVLGAGIAVGAAEWRNRTITPQFEATAPVAVLRLSDESDDRFNRRVETVVAQARTSVSAQLQPGQRVEAGEQDGSIHFVAIAPDSETALDSATGLRQAYLDSKPEGTAQDQLSQVLDALIAEIDSVQKQLAELETSTQPDPNIEAQQSALTSKLQSAFQQRADLKAQLLDPGLSEEDRQTAQSNLEHVDNLIAVLEDELATLPDTTAATDTRTQMDILVLKKRLSDLQSQYIAAATQAGQLGNEGLVGEAYVVDQTPSEISLFPAGLVGLALGFLSSALGVLAVDRLNQPIRSPDDLPGLRVIEVSPRRSFQNSFDWYRLARQDARKSQIQALRAQLEQGRSGSVVMIAGLDVSNATVAMLATDLAVSVAESGLKVLMIDAVLEMSDRSDESNAEHTLSEMLKVQRGRDGDPSAIKRMLSERRETIPNLLQVPAGALDQDPADALSGPPFRTVISEARELVDLVVVSAAPLGETASDTVASNSRYGILLARKNRTRRESLRAAIARLEELGVPPVGVALLATRRRAQSRR